MRVVNLAAAGRDARVFIGRAWLRAVRSCDERS